MLMQYHWGHSPGHLYMYQGWPFQSTGSTHQRDGSRVNNITWAQDDSDSTINEQILGNDKSVQMWSDLDDANSDINADMDSDHGGSSSGTASKRSEGSLDDDDNNDWEVRLTYEDWLKLYILLSNLKCSVELCIYLLELHHCPQILIIVYLQNVVEMYFYTRLQSNVKLQSFGHGLAKSI